MENAYRLNPKFLTDFTQTELEEKIDSLDISDYGLDETAVINNNVTYVVDENHPIAYANASFLFGHLLCFEKKYYFNHKEELDSLLRKSISESKRSSISIHDYELINEDLLKAIASNPNITDVKLGCQTSIFTLTPEIIKIFEGSNVQTINTDSIDPSLENDFRKIVGYNSNKRLIGYDTYAQLQSSTLYYVKDIKSEEIPNLKYLNPEAKVDIKYNGTFELKDVLKVLIESGHKGDISIHFEEKLKNRFTMELLTIYDEIKEKNIKVGTSIVTEYPLNEYLNYETKLLKMVEAAKDLSPFEKYLYAYNAVKKFKPYKENLEDSQDSRNLYKILDSDYIVCAGYAHLLQDLLEKLGIHAQYYSAGVVTTFDTVSNEERVATEDEVEIAGHARVSFHLTDPKYGIDGFYLCDPTWDNYMNKDSYSYAIMTHNDYDTMNRDNQMYLGNGYELFFVNSMEEFSLKANLWMNKELAKRKDPNGQAINALKSEISKLNPELYEQLCNDNPQLKNDSYIPNGKNKEKFLNTIMSYITYANSISPKAFEGKIKQYNLRNLFKTTTKEDFYKEYYSIVNSYSNAYNPVEEDFIKKIIDNLIILAPEIVQALEEKYGFTIGSKVYWNNPNEHVAPSVVITEIGDIILSKVNKRVSGEALRGAITELYAKCYGTPEDKLEETVDEIFAYNAAKYERAFPTRIAYKPDGTEEIYASSENLFEGQSR